MKSRRSSPGRVLPCPRWCASFPNAAGGATAFPTCPPSCGAARCATVRRWSWRTPWAATSSGSTGTPPGRGAHNAESNNICRSRRGGGAYLRKHRKGLRLYPGLTARVKAILLTLSCLLWDYVQGLLCV